MATRTEGSHLIPLETAEDVARLHFGIDGSSQRLVGWGNQNFLIADGDGKRFVLKLSDTRESHPDRIAAQQAVLERLNTEAPDLPCPRVVPTVDGRRQTVVSLAGHEYVVRLLSYLDGSPLATTEVRDIVFFAHLGRFMGTLDLALAGFKHYGAVLSHDWDLANALEVINRYSDAIPSVTDRRLIDRLVSRVGNGFSSTVLRLRRSVIHNDANDHNLLVDTSGAKPVVSGIIDFGDLVETCTVFEPAIAAAYAMLGKSNPMSVAVQLIAGYHRVYPLHAAEVDLLYSAIVLRMCVSVSLSAYRSTRDPGDDYLTVSEGPAWELLRQLESVSPHAASEMFRSACNIPSDIAAPRPTTDIVSQRARHVGPNLSVSYHEPLQIVRGSMQYLYDEKGREYLDTVNNVCHVGHCHPRVVRAAQSQIARLNTNTRYLNELLSDCAARLCETLPSPLEVCYFVCSGSEANELALRLARAHTRHNDVIVVDGAYHGNTTSLIALSPYKHNGSGGGGTPPFVQVASIPDTYRGEHTNAASAGLLYAEDVSTRIADVCRRGQQPAAFFCESVPSCAGQVILPQGYLQEVYHAVREAGGVCVADEVQVGFGRVGSHFWGFELQDVVPDIVTMGKPMGNGHPVAAVVTTAEIARSFDNGMEYFNTFGGNPVSCAVALTVLDVIRDEHLQENAHAVGKSFLQALDDLRGHHELIGDVRGVGLFLGVELVSDRKTKEPATKQAKDVVEELKSNAILASTDGPYDNVLKIKPPLCFTKANADRYVSALDESLRKVSQRSK